MERKLTNKEKANIRWHVYGLWSQVDKSQFNSVKFMKSMDALENYLKTAKRETKSIEGDF
jgi:5'-deoxynucleotidase YfbR-like HD superfamily hydrolase